MKKYSLEIKLNAIQDYLKGMESFEDTAKRHNVTTTKLKKWVAKYRFRSLGFSPFSFLPYK
ncbi:MULTISPECIES: transposase [Heyndrickxia]|jgi:transposase-like protein|uniref:Transposase n=1 Tax=Heyndrickxia oleronia TaxID=38875 RepID=A0A8E2I8W3_9BACI|nr:transposase [Heyndrickxia oleronia]OJH20415.1 hypothetical protein BLX88_02440 [Bacillus obstructivus]MBU5213500.1 transposase [Heyndrickxia oleronia]MCI1590287.1 transposase [Heyndrickxia oleronia]MCI1614069.1 transposase [Heyndrickxia oleronia]MCI1745223.1 transposase [Heyndrickxia oleronia]